MQAVILGGGLATRMKSLKINLPKALLPVADKPFIWHQLKLLKKAGFFEFILAIEKNKKEKFEKMIDKKKLGVKIKYSSEPRPLGTAGALRQALPLLKNNFLVTNCDIYFKMNYQQLIKKHCQKKAQATLTLIKRGDKINQGSVAIDKNKNIICFEEKNPKTKCRYISAGVYIINKSVIAKLPKNKNISLEKEVFPKLIGKNFQAYIASGFYADLGTAKLYKKFLKIAKRVI